MENNSYHSPSLKSHKSQSSMKWVPVNDVIYQPDMTPLNHYVSNMIFRNIFTAKFSICLNLTAKITHQNRNFQNVNAWTSWFQNKCVGHTSHLEPPTWIIPKWITKQRQPVLKQPNDSIMQIIIFNENQSHEQTSESHTLVLRWYYGVIMMVLWWYS